MTGVFYDSNVLSTVSREPPPRSTGPFESCGDCPYASVGFVCHTAEGNCLRTEMQKIQKRKDESNDKSAAEQP
ncbi:MAG: hypothetical protein AB7C97_11795 [Oscillospiraceae bacterium]